MNVRKRQKKMAKVEFIPRCRSKYPTRKWSWIGIVLQTPISSRDTAWRSIELIKESKWEKLFLSTHNWLLSFYVDRFQSPLNKVLAIQIFCNFLHSLGCQVAKCYHIAKSWWWRQVGTCSLSYLVICTCDLHIWHHTSTRNYKRPNFSVWSVRNPFAAIMMHRIF